MEGYIFVEIDDKRKLITKLELYKMKTFDLIFDNDHFHHESDLTARCIPDAFTNCSFCARPVRRPGEGDI